MATRLYFRNATHSLSGTLPSTEQSTATANWTATGATTLKTLSTTQGSSQTSHSGTSQATTATQSGLLGYFVSAPLAGNQTVGGGSMILNAAENEGNLASNFWVNALHVYVWRPSTGTLVGTVRDAGATSLGGLEPTSASSIQVTHITGITSSAVSAQTGDVVVVEVWSRFTQTMGSGYTSVFYFDGATTNTTENAVVSNHASFIELTENLVFVKNADLASNQTASAVAVGNVAHDPLSISLVGVATGASSITIPAEATPQDIAVALAFRDGSTTPPSLPTGWENIATQSGTACGARVAVLKNAGLSNWTLLGSASFPDSNTGFTNDIYDIEYGNGLWVAVGAFRVMAKSTNGYSWTNITGLFTNNSIASVNYLNGLWLVGGSDNYATSSDGNTWTVRSAPLGINSANGFAYGAGVYVAVGSQGNIASSTDAITWTARTSGVTNSLEGVAFGNSIFVAVGIGPILFSSTDGITWTERTSNLPGWGSGVHFANGLFVAFGEGGGIATSTDGINWTQRTSGFGSTDVNDVYYLNGKWIAVGAAGKASESSDGTSWTAISSIAFGSVNANAVASDGSVKWVVAGDSGNMSTRYGIDNVFTNATSVVCNVYSGLDSTTPIGLTASTSGTGTTVTLPAVSNAATSFVGGFVGHSSTDVTFPVLSALSAINQTNPLTSSDGVYTVTYGGSLFVAAGTGGKLITSPDGSAWTSRTSSLSQVIYCAAHNGTNLWAVAGASGALATSADGISWTSQTSSFGTSSINGIAFGGGLWVACGAAGKIASSSNGTSWTQQTSNAGSVDLFDVAYGNSLWVAAGASGALVTSPDGTTWTSQTSGFGSDSILGVAYGAGVWVIAGVNGKIAYSSNGTSWTSRTSGMGTTNIRFVKYANGQFIAGGDLGGITFSDDGINWSLQSSDLSTDARLQDIAGDGNTLVLVHTVFDANALVSILKTTGRVIRRTSQIDATDAIASYDSGGAVL